MINSAILSMDVAAGEGPRRNRFAVQRTAGTMPVFKPRVERASFAPDQIVRTDIQTSQTPDFKDFIDIINPLQHIPVVGHFYRKWTGDEISPAAQFIGSALYGGPVGGIAALTDIAVREQTGQGSMDTMMGFLGRTPADAQTGAPPVQLAARKPEAPRTAGTMPVWGQPAMPGPAGPLAPETGFALLLNDLSGPRNPSPTPYIS